MSDDVLTAVVAQGALSRDEATVLAARHRAAFINEVKAAIRNGGSPSANPAVLGKLLDADVLNSWWPLAANR